MSQMDQILIALIVTLLICILTHGILGLPIAHPLFQVSAIIVFINSIIISLRKIKCNLLKTN